MSKTEEGERSIALPASLAAASAAHSAQTAYESDDDYVFRHPKRGSQINQEWYAGEFRKAGRRFG